MENQISDRKQNIETDFHYAIVAGWLILPALNLLFAFIGSFLDLFVSDLGIILYVINLLVVIFLFVTIIFWAKRKQVLPKLMVIFFVYFAVSDIILVFYGYADNRTFLSIALDIIWIMYFIRSKRVKATFRN